MSNQGEAKKGCPGCDLDICEFCEVRDCEKKEINSQQGIWENFESLWFGAVT